MTQQPSQTVSPPPDHLPTPPYYVSLALLSGAGIFLEIALTRLFSTLFYPPDVFAVISVAILGIGLGAALATAQTTWRSLPRLSMYLLLAGYSTLVLLLVAVLTVTVQVYGLLLLMVLLPYLFLGLSLATIFGAAPSAAPKLYRTDLLGAGLGAIFAIPLLNWLGGINSLLAVAALFGLAALLAQPRFRWDSSATHLLSIGLCAVAAAGLVANLIPASRWLDIDMANLAAAKPISERLAADGRIIETRWDSFARTDLIDPGQGRPYEIYIDGAAGSVMPPAQDLNLLRNDIGFFPFATTQPKDVFVVGPGGGLDVWFGLNSQALSISAVEINPASIALVNRYPAYHGDLYRQPNVRVLIDEGRSVLRREGKKYDLIFLSQVVTLAGERSGYALTENTVYTIEAFVDYLHHLQPAGQLVMKLYDELTLSRAMATAVTALVQARGLSEAEAMRHIAIFLDPDAEPPVPLLVVQNQPFTPDDGQSFAVVAARVDFVPLFVPGVAANPTLAGLLQGDTGLETFLAASPADISPTSDDRPFFYQFERGLPASLRPLLWGLGLVMLLGLVAVVALQRQIADPPARYAPLYFAALGSGFIMLEIAFIQQTRLFLGHPTLAVTTILAVLLIGGGIGSGLAGHWPDTVRLKRLLPVIVAIVILSLMWPFFWPWFNHSFLGLQPFGRVLIIVAIFVPLALLLGIPFPMGLWLVGQYHPGDRHIALAWAVNSVMTVAGSAAAIAIAMLSGFSMVILIGTGAYAVAAIFIAVVLRRS